MNNGPPIDSRQRVQLLKWSKFTNFKVEVIDKKLDKGVLYFKDHFTGWHHRFGEWIIASNPLETPLYVITASAEDKEFFFEQLKITIKEKLTYPRDTNSIVTIRIVMKKVV